MKETEAHHPLTDFIEYGQEEMLARAQAHYQEVKRRHSIRQFSDRAVPKPLSSNVFKRLQPRQVVPIISLGISLRSTILKLKRKFGTKLRH